MVTDKGGNVFLAWGLTIAVCLALLIFINRDSQAGEGVLTAVSAGKCSALRGSVMGRGQAVITTARITEGKDAGSPTYCLVEVDYKDSDLKFEARLPVLGWNSRLVVMGGSGFDGKIVEKPAYLSQSITKARYATVMTNGGYEAPLPENYFEAEFAFDPVKLTDFTYASDHRVLPVVNELLQTVYGREPEKRYFEGCSMGGHDAMMLSQRFPDDFDGIVARAPAGNVVGSFIKFHRIARVIRQSGEPLSRLQQNMLAQAVLDRCDALDGLEDGLVSNPMACHLDVTTLQCSTEDKGGDICLTPVQVALISEINSPFDLMKPRINHPGFPIAGAANPDQWGEYIWPRPMYGDKSRQELFAGGFVRSFITRDRDYETADWNPEDWRASLDLITSMFQAFDSDLSDFSGRGGKLILWTGVADSAISLRDIVGYYDDVARKMGREKAADTVELFLAPGVGHCRGGSGPEEVDLMAALSTWVEEGIPPSKQALEHRKIKDGGPQTLSRPLCKYPSYPRYDGAGNPDHASSFVCSE